MRLRAGPARFARRVCAASPRRTPARSHPLQVKRIESGEEEPPPLAFYTGEEEEEEEEEGEDLQLEQYTSECRAVRQGSASAARC